MAVSESNGWQPKLTNKITWHKCSLSRSSQALGECLAKGVVVQDVPQPRVTKMWAPKRVDIPFYNIQWGMHVQLNNLGTPSINRYGTGPLLRPDVNGSPLGPHLHVTTPKWAMIGTTGYNWRCATNPVTTTHVENFNKCWKCVKITSDMILSINLET